MCLAQKLIIFILSKMPLLCFLDGTQINSAQVVRITHGRSDMPRLYEEVLRQWVIAIYYGQTYPYTLWFIAERDMILAYRRIKDAIPVINISA